DAVADLDGAHLVAVSVEVAVDDHLEGPVGRLDGGGAGAHHRVAERPPRAVDGAGGVEGDHVPAGAVVDVEGDPPGPALTAEGDRHRRLGELVVGAVPPVEPELGLGWSAGDGLGPRPEEPLVAGAAQLDEGPGPAVGPAEGGDAVPADVDVAGDGEAGVV